MKSIITTKNVKFSYSMDKSSKIVVDDVSIDIKKGEFIVLLGRNGSGKSTFARLLNALLIPCDGIVLVNGIDTQDEKRLWDIRKTVGMVFQNPDNQIIGTTVEEDTAFGPENMGIEPSEIRRRVNSALGAVGMESYMDHSPHMLSGGQKQRVSIAGIIAMKPQCIVLDESTAMLDPKGRKEVLDVIHKLNKEEGITIILITHHMEEAKDADMVHVLDNGRLALSGSPREVFSKVHEIYESGLEVPPVTDLIERLKEKGLDLPSGISDINEAADAISRYIKNTSGGCHVNSN